jgi:hypothetical protein
MRRTIDNPLYYLDNFQTVLDWIIARYDDLLESEEKTFIAEFTALPQPSRALLVRMVMRKGDCFRLSKLNYNETGSTREAMRPLVNKGWVDQDPPLELHALFGLLRKNELASLFSLSRPHMVQKKTALLEQLSATYVDARRFSEWRSDCPLLADECVYQLVVMPLCDRLRLLFFGNLHQDWSEFVLADLGVIRYEKVAFSVASRGFRSRRDFNDYLHLHRCRQRFHNGEALEEILQDIGPPCAANPWLESKRAKLLFALAQAFEQAGHLTSALDIYLESTFPGARIRAIRVLEKCERIDSAYQLACTAEAAPESEAEIQHLARLLPRLHRKLGHGKTRRPEISPIATFDLTLPAPQEDIGVEQYVRAHLATAGAPAYYVENTLINSLFGLLCWDAIFAAVPGAFFHPFQSGPADLASPDFPQRRAREFALCFSLLDSDAYRATIRRHMIDKAGTQSPFVAWNLLDEALVNHALHCIPPAHLKQWFERILLDIKANRSGFPDLIQFWPQERRYRMIEVKGPGDRLQDNQVRWLNFCVAQHMPVSVCYVHYARCAAAA